MPSSCYESQLAVVRHPPRAKYEDKLIQPPSKATSVDLVRPEQYPSKPIARDSDESGQFPPEVMVVLEALKAVELEETILNNQLEQEKLVLEQKVRPSSIQQWEKLTSIMKVC
jgi:hypothetical protein